MHLRKGTAADHSALLAIWERGVRVTHHFLFEPEIQRQLAVVRDRLLPGLELWVLCDEGETPIGWMALDDAKLAVLCVAPARFRQGGGSRLLEQARELKGRLTVDVHERNTQALEFFRARGFEVTGRAPLDEPDQSLPVLRLQTGR